MVRHFAFQPSLKFSAQTIKRQQIKAAEQTDCEVSDSQERFAVIRKKKFELAMLSREI
jgi:hypothetical protein